jgi:hypothetical protein
MALISRQALAATGRALGTVRSVLSLHLKSLSFIFLHTYRPVSALARFASSSLRMSPHARACLFRPGLSPHALSRSSLLPPLPPTFHSRYPRCCSKRPGTSAPISLHPLPCLCLPSDTTSARSSGSVPCCTAPFLVHPFHARLLLCTSCLLLFALYGIVSSLCSRFSPPFVRNACCASRRVRDFYFPLSLFRRERVASYEAHLRVHAPRLVFPIAPFSSVSRPRLSSPFQYYIFVRGPASAPSSISLYQL